MLNRKLRDHVTSHILPRVQMPAQYLGGELNMVRKDHRDVRGKLCMAFPDTYSIGMSHHGLQVLYTLMNQRDDWVCERVFTPWDDMEAELRRAQIPLHSLESFTPLSEFDVLGITLQYEICSSNLLTMLDLGGIPLHARERAMSDPLVIAGGPCAQNPEPLAPFIDFFVSGDGEPALPLVCDQWMTIKAECPDGGCQDRDEALARLASKLPFAYVPRFYEPEYFSDGRFAALNRTRTDVPIKNEDLYDGCREAFRNGFQRVKLYFMCGLPGEREVDLTGIIEMAEMIAKIGRQERGRYTKVVASVSKFVPKAHTPYQWNGIQTREYFQWAHQFLRKTVRLRSVQIKCHDTETSLLEGVLSRGDRRVADAVELAWRRGARLDSWSERFHADLWWNALDDSGIDVEKTLHGTYPLDVRLPWDHINVKKGRTFLEKEQNRAVMQLSTMANAK